MGEIIGTLQRETLCGELTLNNLKSIEDAVWRMTRENPFQSRSHDPNGDTIQVIYPGPVLSYKLQKNNKYDVKIFHNNGNKALAEQLHKHLIAYAQSE
jgi:hypothetical protein